MDRETVIKLSGRIEKLRALVREAEDMAAKRRAQLFEAENQLDQVLGSASPSLAPRAEALDLIGNLRNAAVHGTSNVPISGTVNVNLSPTSMDNLPRTFFSFDLIDDDEKPVTTRLRDFFITHPTHSFGTQELMELCSIPRERDGAVRQALKRMFDEGFLLRERDGVYTLNVARKRSG